MMSRKKHSLNGPCPCHSRKKYKHCCYAKKKGYAVVSTGGKPPQYPLGTVARYGPDDKTTTKIAASVFVRYGAEPIMQRWVATDIMTNSRIQQEIGEFFRKHGAKTVRSVRSGRGNREAIEGTEGRERRPLLSKDEPDQRSRRSSLLRVLSAAFFMRAGRVAKLV
jgi:hypothetical protein